MWGMNGNDGNLEELTPEFLDTFIKNAKVFNIIDFNPQVIADLVWDYPLDEEKRIQAMMKRYSVTKDQAKLAMTLPLCELPLYMDKEEYLRQIKRLEKLRQIVKEVQDVLK